MIGDPALQDAEEQRPPIGAGPPAVTPDQCQHGVLHDVQRILRVPDAEAGHVEGPFLDLRKEGIHLRAVIHGVAVSAPEVADFRGGLSSISRAC